MPKWLFEWTFSNRSFFKRINIIVSVSKDLQSKFIQEYPTAQDKVRVIYNGVDAVRFHPGVDGLKVRQECGIDPDEVDSIKRSAQSPVSLEKPVGDEEESEFGQFIADEKAESPFDRAADLLTKEALKESLENLSYRERRVLELRYGLGGEHPRTLDEVGRTFNVTRERIRQIENQSPKKLQSLNEAQKLREAT